MNAETGSGDRSFPGKLRVAKSRKPQSSASGSQEESAPSAPKGERLQKVLAAAGLGSRRSCEELIVSGRVEIDRKTVTELGVRVTRDQEIRVDGQKLARPKRQYYALHKPTGVISTNRDPSGRLRVIDLIDSHERLFAVGRLDKSSEGLILVTNDGELAQRLTHPKYEVEKTYRVEVAGQVEQASIEKLQAGVHLAEGFARVARVRIRKVHPRSTELEIVLKEGRNREVRRLLAAIGHKVERLTRIAIGPLRLGDLPAGAHRALSRDEVRQLMEAAQGAASKRKGAKPSGPKAGQQRAHSGAKRPVARGAAKGMKERGTKPRPPAESLGVIIGAGGKPARAPKTGPKKPKPRTGQAKGAVGKSGRPPFGGPQRPGKGNRFGAGKRPGRGKGQQGRFRGGHGS